MLRITLLFLATFAQFAHGQETISLLCKPGFKSDGARMCYKQYSDFENNGKSHTITSITKKHIGLGGKIKDYCPDGKERDGALCYDPCKPGFIGKNAMCYSICDANSTDVGLMCRDKCQPGYTDVSGVCWEDCPEGYTNDGLTCRRPAEIYGKGCCTVGGFCRNKCPEGFNEDPCTCRKDAHIFGRKSIVPGTRGKSSEGRYIGTPLQCPPDHDELTKGLCYARCPEGYERKSIAVCTQICPPESKDFGVGCSRESYDMFRFGSAVFHQNGTVERF